jgi:hypothetical protein
LRLLLGERHGRQQRRASHQGERRYLPAECAVSRGEAAEYEGHVFADDEAGWMTSDDESRLPCAGGAAIHAVRDGILSRTRHDGQQPHPARKIPETTKRHHIREDAAALRSNWIAGAGFEPATFGL